MALVCMIVKGGCRHPIATLGFARCTRRVMPMAPDLFGRVCECRSRRRPPSCCNAWDWGFEAFCRQLVSTPSYCHPFLVRTRHRQAVMHMATQLVRRTCVMPNSTGVAQSMKHGSSWTKTPWGRLVTLWGTAWVWLRTGALSQHRVINHHGFYGKIGLW